MRISLEGGVKGFVDGGADLHGGAVDGLSVGEDEAEGQGGERGGQVREGVRER